MAARGAVAVFAKQNAKQRERLSEKQRQYNKSRKSAVATRMRKVCYLLYYGWSRKGCLCQQNEAFCMPAWKHCG